MMSIAAWSGGAGERERYPDLQYLGVPEGQFVALPGRGTTFIREVAGPPGAPVLMLLHGLSATGGTNWSNVFAGLGEHYRVIAIDHRGHGRGIRSAHFSLDDCADDVVALADVLGIDQFVPVGYSMGGPIAQLIYHRHPERVAAMVLVATSRDFRGRIDDQIKFFGLGALNLTLHGVPGVLRAGGWSAIARVVSGGFGTTGLRKWAGEDLGHNDPRMVCEAALALGSYSSRDWISDIEVPVAVIATQHDQLVPLRRQVRMAEKISTAVLHPLNGDHFVAARRPEAFLAMLSDCCDEVCQRRDEWLAEQLPAHAGLVGVPHPQTA